jgi:hypothetical protein
VFNDIVSGFAREYVQNGDWLPKAARTVCAAIFAVGALAFPEPIIAGVVTASEELTAQLMNAMQPIIANITDKTSSAGSTTTTP